MAYVPKIWVPNTLIAYTDMNNIETGIQEAFLPTGMIMLWYGTALDVPTGWHICDGTNGTPDLLDKFVVCAGSTYTKGSEGGEAEHTLTIPEMPAHTHSYIVTGGTGSNQGGGPGSYDLGKTTGSTGGGLPHNNLPPYHALYYIMKL